MSIEEKKVKLSKEEKEAKKARKEAKKLKEAEIAAPAPATTSEVTPAEAVEGISASAKKEKKNKDKKRKDREEINGEAIIRGEESGAEKVKKNKDDKKKRKIENGEVAQPDPATLAAPTAVEATTLSTPSEATSGLSKKQLKKLARAAEAEAAAATAGPSTTEPLITPTAFTTAHNEYLTTNAVTLIPQLYPPQLDISALPISDLLRPFLKKFTNPTPIQACSWPPLLASRDVVGIAETGSGKTLAFGVPGMNRLVQSGKKKKGPHMLVIAPTRELALQSHTTLIDLGKEAGVKSICVYGGVGKIEQIAGIKESKIVVGTPGRLLDLADSGDLDLSGVQYLTLDEADRMLDAGFENDIRRIIAHCPDKTAGRQTVMFSATWPETVRRLAATFLNDPVRITVGSDELSANKRIEQIVEVLEPFGKDVRLQHHLRAHMKAHPSSDAAPTRILVFALYKKEAQRLEQTIRRYGFSVMGLHGDMDQNARFKALDAFKEGKVNILVATDVAARGLDIPDVGLVLNVTFPLTTEDFVHRCGRTGRAGKSGKAVTFFTGENHEKSLAGEFMRVLRDVGAEIPKEMDQFPSTIKKKEHGSYGAFYRDTTNAPKATKITFD